MTTSAHSGSTSECADGQRKGTTGTFILLYMAHSVIKKNKTIIYGQLVDMPLHRFVLQIMRLCFNFPGYHFCHVNTAV